MHAYILQMLISKCGMVDAEDAGHKAQQDAGQEGAGSQGGSAGRAACRDQRRASLCCRPYSRGLCWRRPCQSSPPGMQSLLPRQDSNAYTSRAKRAHMHASICIQASTQLKPGNTFWSTQTPLLTLCPDRLLALVMHVCMATDQP